MNEIKVSILIPVYNVSEYLRRCLDSCVNQTMQEIEIIVVNDCSPDPLDTEIMREYELNYPGKVRCIWHSENKKLGAARNTGITAAVGEFIYCLDSDDYIEHNLCEKMYGAILAEDADMAVCDCERIERNKTITNWESNGDLSSMNVVDRMTELKLHSVCLVMIRKSVIIENDLLFPELFFEDLFCVLWYIASRKIVRVYENLYHYVIRSNSIMQARQKETYKQALTVISLALQSDCYRKLDKEAKELVFLYFMRHVLDLVSVIRYYHIEDFVEYCASVLSLESEFGYDVKDISFDSIHRQYVVNCFEFIKTNISFDDFKLEYTSYHKYQHHFFMLKLCRDSLKTVNDKRITIWGAGKRGIKNSRMLRELDVEFEVTDGNIKLYGTEIIPDIIVKPWSELREHTDIVFVSVVGRFNEIARTILADSPNVEVRDFDSLTEWRL